MKKICLAWCPILGVGAIAVMAVIYCVPANLLSYAEVTVIILTLSVLSRYAYDTYRLSDASVTHFQYLSTPVISAKPERVWGSSKAPELDPRTQLVIWNDSRFNIKVRVSIVFEYLENRQVHEDHYYSGVTPWNASPGEGLRGHFGMLSFFNSLGHDAKSMIEKLQASSPPLRMYVFSSFCVVPSEPMKFTHNPGRSYVLQFDEGVELPSTGSLYDHFLPYSWIPEFTDPPQEVEKLARNSLTGVVVD